MTDNYNPFKGLAGVNQDAEVTPERDLPSRVSRTASIPADEVLVPLSTRIRKKAHTKLKKAAQAADMSIQDYVERLILNDPAGREDLD